MVRLNGLVLSEDGPALSLPYLGRQRGIEQLSRPGRGQAAESEGKAARNLLTSVVPGNLLHLTLFKNTQPTF